MITIMGIGNATGPLPPRPVNNRRQDQGKDAVQVQDGLQMSTEALEAANRAHFVTESNQFSKIREARVQEAKQNIQEGRHRIESVVSQVAARIARFVEYA